MNEVARSLTIRADAMGYPKTWDSLRTRKVLTERIAPVGHEYERTIACTVCGGKWETKHNTAAARLALRVEAIEHVRFQHPEHFKHREA